MSVEKTTAPKLTEEHKQVIKQMLATFEPVNDIVDYLKDEYDVDVSSRLIYYYSKEHHKDIEKIRLELNIKFEAIPIANKFNRIQTRQGLVDDLLANLWYEDTKGKQKGNHTAINQLLDSTQKELEPFKIAQTDSEGHDVTDEERFERIMALLDRAREARNGKASKPSKAVGTRSKK